MVPKVDPNCVYLKYKLISIVNNEHIGYANSVVSKFAEHREFRVGDKIPISDFVIYRNNSKRFREFIIEKIVTYETDPFMHLAYVRYVKETNVNQNENFDLQKISKKKMDSIDRSGEDDWLHPA